MFLTCGGLMNNQANIPFAVRACGLQGCYKPGAGSDIPMRKLAHLHSPLSSAGPILHPAGSKSPVQRDAVGEARDFRGQLHGTGSRPLPKPATHFLPVVDCSRLEGCGHLTGSRDVPREGREVLTLISAKSLLKSLCPPAHAYTPTPTHPSKS